MNSKTIIFAATVVALNAFIYAASAMAQCGAGIPSGGNPLCIPPDVYNNQANTQSQTVPVQQKVVIQQKWADRWGAITADGKAGALGFVTGYHDKYSAEQAAVRQCKSDGGVNCPQPFSFHNQCAAFVVSDAGMTWTSAVNERAASMDALDRCQKKHGGCRVYKTACSHAEAVPIR